ncbi:uncharacterized protein LOC128727850 [Anopheles nili]|uniref:uncharacterized protein LOC128727850 n=1 Tax=Anopheles nili TaxID=185578 RepID=UPI00237A8605|nr:uncharacterized protein LOC128727850 [Anopheles nili]
MSRQLFCALLMVACFGLSFAGFLDWFREPEHDGHKVGRIHVEVLAPKGIRLWTAYNPETDLFGVELYVKYYGGQTEALECALCRNVTLPVDGKFMIEDQDLVARFGDVLQYSVITSNGTTTERHAVRRMFVREELIKPNDRCVCQAGEPAASLQDTPLSEVELLEHMILRALSNRSRDCESISNWLVLRAEPRHEQADLQEYVRSYLDLLLLRAKSRTRAVARWSRWRPSEQVLLVEDHSDGIAFQVRTTIDKLKMLALMSSDGVMVDYDEIF